MNNICERILRDGWASKADLEDFLLLADHRIGVLSTKLLFEFAEISPRFVFPRPERRKDSVFGFESISAPDAAGLLILAERLGFELELTHLCD